MKCSEAARLIVQSVLAEGGDQLLSPLAEHLASCTACADRLAAYQAVRAEISTMPPVRAPAQAEEFVAQGIRHALMEKRRLRRPPANPRPERPASQKALIVVGALACLMALTVSFLAISRGRYQPVSSVAEVSLRVGAVEVRTPGAWAWRQMASKEFLPPGVEFRTGPDSLLKLRNARGEWWLPGASAIGLRDQDSADLLAGRVYVRCYDADGKAVTLTAANGQVTCQDGEFVAFASMKRLRVGCVSGRALVGRQGEQTALGPGQCAMLFEQELVLPVRNVRMSELTHWLRQFDAYGEGHLSPRQLAAVPLTPERSALPATVAVDGLAVRVMASGPAALVAVTAALRNDGTVPWSATLTSEGLVLPPPLAEVGSGAVELLPGAAGRCEVMALCVLRARNGSYSLGLNPEAWTRGEVGRVSLAVNCAAEGGLRLFECPTWSYRAKRAEGLTWSSQRERVEPRVPVVLDLRFQTADGVDVLPLRGEHGKLALIVWRPDLPEEEWIKRGRAVFVALDATADFGAGGGGYAQQVMETVLGFLPPGCSTALMAYDGGLKVDADRLTRHYPVRVETMLKALWQLEPGAQEGGNDFLRDAVNLSSRASHDGVLVALTGRGRVEPVAAAPELLAGDALRIAVLEVGASQPLASYRALCAASGGVAVALPECAAPDLAALDFLANLQWPALRQVKTILREDVQGVVLQGEGSFANQPVAVLVALPEGADAVSGQLQAWAGSRRIERQFSLAVEPAQLPVDSPLVVRLAEKLQSALLR